MELIKLLTIVFHELQLQHLLSQASLETNSFSYDIQNVSYPDDTNSEWRNELEKAVNKPGTFLRLYFPVSLMKTIAGI